MDEGLGSIDDKEVAMQRSGLAVCAMGILLAFSVPTLSAKPGVIRAKKAHQKVEPQAGPVISDSSTVDFPASSSLWTDSPAVSVSGAVALQEVVAGCPVINGTLGSGSPDWPSTSGNQTGRLNRNGISSACGAPKSCNIFDTTPGRAYDAYVFQNLSGSSVCVAVNLNVLTQSGCNLQSNAYLGTYNPANVCTNYLADPGQSSGIPPSPTNFSFDVPGGMIFTIVVHTTNPGEIGCAYQLSITGFDCAGYDTTFVDDGGASTFCLARSTGFYDWGVTAPPAAYKNRAEVMNGGSYVWNGPTDPNFLYVVYDAVQHRAYGYFYDTGSNLFSSLYDSDTTDDVATCP
jgi:hypothetical protein